LFGFGVKLNEYPFKLIVRKKGDHHMIILLGW
jgi:hypothetical protein